MGKIYSGNVYLILVILVVVVVMTMCYAHLSHSPLDRFHLHLYFAAALLMRQMAQQFESAAERLAESAESKADEQLIDRSYIARLRATYPTMHGFPLHFTCGIDDKSWQEPSSTNPILRRLRSTLLHLTEEPDAAFAVAVVSHGYTTRFASVWVYYAMVSRAQ